ncbi:hypothetical protein SAMN04487896_5701 [Paenibacillus sp. ov031]|nr:hypothetical protein SAMN04487896_5701 [Paenibacillus sp. ov031]SLK19085.1 hypothetical protein SAMN06272722_113116 [Paenibacillus sp. RU5A]SOC75609.1 hypothetical protein SAMN05880581_113116 [Paenibacillus sp. RU26A]SOC77560.1 hypothetical protein SAMN05880586_113117 [Paenibacillus sp. RU5M]
MSVEAVPPFKPSLSRFNEKEGFLYVSDIYVFAILFKLNNAKFVMFVTVLCKYNVNNSSYMKFIWRKIYIYIIVYVNDIY